ncbi:MAG: AraC family transcriptional regulator [Bacillota bacterium]|nr:AraC family transcriptional regulator [Bacillota bacterium]
MMNRIDFHIINECRCRHEHDHPQLILPLTETLHMWVARQEYHVRPGELCFIPSSTEHQCLCKSGLIVVDVPLALIGRQDRQSLETPQIFPIPKELQPIVELIINELTSNPNSSSIYYLYYYLYSKIMENRSTQSLRYIQDHYDEPITVSFLAEMENYNVTYYNAWFKQQTGMSPAQYLRQLRMSKARELLCATDMEIVDIAIQVGYNSHSAFTRAFKSVMGMPPQEFRVRYHLAPGDFNPSRN